MNVALQICIIFFEANTVSLTFRNRCQFRKVYNAMVRTYGAPDQINLEIGRDLKKSRDERNQIMRRQKENETERKEAADWLDLPQTVKTC